MLPEGDGRLEAERMTQAGESSLPVTLALEDVDNSSTLFYFMTLLHDSKCMGRTANQPVVANTNCIATCMFVRMIPLRNCGIHYQHCNRVNCPAPFCKQAVALHQHWEMCDKPSCFICRNTVRLLVDNFCVGLLTLPETDYSSLVVNLQKRDLLKKKQLVRQWICYND